MKSNAESEAKKPEPSLALRGGEGALDTVKDLSLALMHALDLQTNDLRRQWKLLREEREKFDQEKASLAVLNAKLDDQVKLLVGGVDVSTTRETLCRFPDSMLAAMFSGRFPMKTDIEGRVFLDRNGTTFQVILDYLREPKKFKVPRDKDLCDRLLTEADFFSLPSLSDLLLEDQRRPQFLTIVWDQKLSPIVHPLKQPKPNSIEMVSDREWRSVLGTLSLRCQRNSLRVLLKTYLTQKATEVMIEGVFCWEFRLIQPYIQFGVAMSKFLDKPGPISLAKGPDSEAWGFSSGFKHDRGASGPINFSPKPNDTLGLVCDMVTRRLTLYHNGNRIYSIEGLFGQVRPVISLQAAVAAAAKIEFLEFEESNFRGFDWLSKSNSSLHQ